MLLTDGSEVSWPAEISFSVFTFTKPFLEGLGWQPLRLFLEPLGLPRLRF